jgi:hypothetical protein
MSNAHRMKHPLLIGAALLALTALPVVAQGDCPAGYACVAYHGHVIEIDPADGFLQQLVTEERTLSITDFNGTNSGDSVTITTFLQDGDTYKVIDERTVAKAGVYADAVFGDVYLATKAGG